MKRMLFGIVMLALLCGAGASAQSGYELFQQALSKEKAEGNLAEAIDIYQRIVKQFASDRALTAKALLQLGDAYQKLGNRQAQQAFERIVRDFSDQKDTVTAAARGLPRRDRPRRRARAGQRVKSGPARTSMSRAASQPMAVI